MRKTIALTLFLSLFIVGCSNDATKPAKTGDIPTDYLNDYNSNPQVTDDRSLLELDQTVSDEKGEASLKAINYINSTNEIGPVQLRIKDMKLIHLKPDYSLIDYFHVLTHEEEFDFVKVFVEIENTTSEKVSFAPIALLETSSGEKFDWEKDVYLEDLNGELEGKASKKGNLGFIVENSDNLEWIEITTSDVFDQEGKKIHHSQKIKIEF
ncbi:MULTISPECIES: hypothetical protein [Bacillaceae]|uniref:hypothetical protein n=1 Tax=Bacillaceae TaxID=186817 RepID=UPI000BFD2847|nr:MULTISPECIES: hypothetical protein [Bacillaceae]PGT84125.1 hypothetical protein COD11_11275 [Bacillus sp. AFS040349]UGB33558.1 hypothetical protein LPC09_26830 [Metabacillus sp. B2-18]